MNPLFTEITASQATSVVGGFSNTATVEGTVAASTGVDSGTYSTDLNGSASVSDTEAKSSLTISAQVNYNN
ncbi:MAG: hypothetical protein KME46_15120 [Brasilonema angustatum HA4187-MV1]|jgi:hypothetical protein|nr:hypothetical protein [Brasilonema angustatum HA4187-MV1]